MNKNKLLYKYLFFDLIASIFVWLLFVVFRKYINNVSILQSIQAIALNPTYYVSFIFFPFYCALIHFLSGFYLNSLKKSKVNAFFTTLVASFIISVSVSFVIMLGDVVISYKYFYYSWLVLFCMQFIITYFFRSIILSEVRHNYLTKKWTINTVIIGTGEKARRIAEDLQTHAPRNTFLGFIAMNKQHVVPTHQILGNISKSDDIFTKFSIDETIVALENNATEHQLFTVINLLYQYNIDIQFTPRLYEILTGSARISKHGIIPLVSITNPSITDWEASIKRVFDIVASSIALLLLSPLLLYVMILIRRDSKGPIFYKQERIGRYGHPFNIVKFRTMFDKSENGTPQLSSLTDSRITKVGGFLRKYRIDEIPQFWNIIKGDMALVGPRPERQFFINQIIEQAPYYCLLYKIRPGLSSWGPIKIGYSDTIEKMIERLNYDIIYMDNMSLAEDIKILIYTFEIIFRGKGI